MTGTENIDISRAPSTLTKDQLLCLEVIRDALAQLENDEMVAANNPQATYVTIKAFRDTRHTMTMGGFGTGVIDTSTQRRSFSIEDDQVSAKHRKNRLTKLLSLSPTPKTRPEISAPKSKMSSISSNLKGGIDQYHTWMPKLLLHTHSHNPVKTLDKYLSSKSHEKATQFISEVVCGKYRHIMTDLSQWKREICTVWTANGRSVMCALTDWSFVQQNSIWESFAEQGTVGTSWRRLAGSEPSTHLMNVYSCHVGGKHTMIRSGVVDTQKKLAQWKSLVAKMIDERKRMGFPLDAKTKLTRVVSLSLVSTSSLVAGEREMATSQNQYMYSDVGVESNVRAWKIKAMEGQKQMKAFSATTTETGIAAKDNVNLSLLAQYIKDVALQSNPTDMALAHGDGIDIVHLNYQTNVKEIGSLFTIQVGERTSRTLNQRGLYRYIDWTLTDTQIALSRLNTASLLKDSNLRALMRSIDTMVSHIPGVNARESDIPDIDSRITNKLHSIAGLLGNFLKVYRQSIQMKTEYCNELVKCLCSVKALSQLLRAHISNDGSISRIQELMLLGLLDCSLNVLSAVNCKSGCDRTGLVYATKCAVAMVWETRPKERMVFVDMIIQMDELSEQHEKIYTKGMDQWALHVLSLEKDSKLHQRELLLCEFRNCVFVNLMDIGWKCILYSTGLPGFKVGSTKDVLKNPHVMPLLPPYIQSPDGVHLNREFRDFFIGASLYRGGDGVGSSV
eukprot:CFRG6397T1